MQKIRIVALLVQKLGWGVIFTPPPPIRLAYIKKPIQNRVKVSAFYPLIKECFYFYILLYSWGKEKDKEKYQVLNGIKKFTIIKLA